MRSVVMSIARPIGTPPASVAPQSAFGQPGGATATIPNVRKSTIIVTSVTVALMTAMIAPIFIERAISDAEYKASVSDDDGDTSVEAFSEPHRIGTAPGTMTTTCSTPSEGYSGPVERARLSATEDEVQVRFEFGDGSLFATGVPNSVSYPGPERMLVVIGDVYTYVIISLSDDGSTIEYSIQDRPTGGERLPGTLRFDDGDLVVTLPRPADLEGPAVRWHVEAQGLECPQAEDLDERYLVTDVFARD